ncbi:MAG: radical SAM protein [Alphaproteobacteria bacterium]|nr:radical SAM protein [Alphaproteobacteria bacterium]
MANLGYLQLTRSCRQFCRFCSNPPTGVELTEPEMRGLIDDLADMDYDGVILTGGEPSMSPLLFPALAYARERGLYSRMITNGQLLADKGFFRQCVDAGLTHIHVSLHSHIERVHDFITRYPGSWQAIVDTLSHVPEMGITADINTVINTYNADHLDLNVRWICETFPFIRHFVWNNMDPDGNRAEENPDCIASHREFQVSLERAMDYLYATGRSFRAERVPLCFMRRYAWASTETRKIVKEEERCIRFLDRKGFVHQLEFLHGKGEACDACAFDPICAGMFSMAKTFDERELSPVFDDPLPAIRQVLGREPEPALLARIQARRGRRSTTEQPSAEQRAAALQRPLG